MPSTMEQMVEAGARAAYEVEHKGLRNCWSWDDQGLDDEHPMARERYRNASEAALRAALPILGEALGDRIWTRDVTANNVRAFISEIMEGK